ncbi:exported hypothetical protein [Vibrio crassostreae]|nr:exported hypothetical protein [Vibrio crassostreae]
MLSEGSYKTTSCFALISLLSGATGTLDAVNGTFSAVNDSVGAANGTLRIFTNNYKNKQQKMLTSK